MTPPSHPVIRALYFVNVLGDTEPSCLSWTKVSVALSTVFTAVTGAAATLQAVVGNVAHTEWQTFAAAIGLHAVAHGARRVKANLDKSA